MVLCGALIFSHHVPQWHSIPWLTFPTHFHGLYFAFTGRCGPLPFALSTICSGSGNGSRIRWNSARKYKLLLLYFVLPQRIATPASTSNAINYPRCLILLIFLRTVVWQFGFCLHRCALQHLFKRFTVGHNWLLVDWFQWLWWRKVQPPSMEQYRVFQLSNPRTRQKVHVTH